MDAQPVGNVSKVLRIEEWAIRLFGSRKVFLFLVGAFLLANILDLASTYYNLEKVEWDYSLEGSYAFREMGRHFGFYIAAILGTVIQLLILVAVICALSLNYRKGFLGRMSMIFTVTVLIVGSVGHFVMAALNLLSNIVVFPSFFYFSSNFDFIPVAFTFTLEGITVVVLYIFGFGDYKSDKVSGNQNK